MQARFQQQVKILGLISRACVGSDGIYGLIRVLDIAFAPHGSDILEENSAVRLRNVRIPSPKYIAKHVYLFELGWGWV